jgi:hypothetical protein
MTSRKKKKTNEVIEQDAFTPEELEELDDMEIDDEEDEEDEDDLELKTPRHFRKNCPSSLCHCPSNLLLQQMKRTSCFLPPAVKKSSSRSSARLSKGARKGYLTYEEINDALPDEIISPARLDSLLMTLDELGVQILDEADVEKDADETLRKPNKVGRGDDEDIEEDLRSKKSSPKAKAGRSTIHPYVPDADGRDSAADPR